MDTELYAIMEHHNKLLMALLTEPDIVSEGVGDRIKGAATVVKNTIINIINKIINVFRKFLGIFKKEKKTKEKSVETAEASQDIVKNKEKAIETLKEKVDNETVEQVSKYIKNLEAMAVPSPDRIKILIIRLDQCLKIDMKDDMKESIDISANKIGINVSGDTIEDLLDSLKEFVIVEALGDMTIDFKKSILSLYDEIDNSFNKSVKKLEELKNEVNKESEEEPRQDLLNKVTICETIQRAIINKFNELMKRLNIMDSFIEKIAESIEAHKKDPKVSGYFPFVAGYIDNNSEKY